MHQMIFGITSRRRTILRFLQLALFPLLLPNYSLHSIFAAASTSLFSNADDVTIGSYYAVVIDAGSTGSRSFVFNITETVSLKDCESDNSNIL